MNADFSLMFAQPILDQHRILLEIHREIEARYKADFKYSTLCQAQHQRLFKFFEPTLSGKVTPEMFCDIVAKDANASPQQVAETMKIALIGHIYNLAKGLQTLIAYPHVVGKGILQFLNGAIPALESGNLLCAFLCFRACLEQTSQNHTLIGKIESLSDPASCSKDDIEIFLYELRQASAKFAFATRFDWTGILSADDVRKQLSSGKFSYVPGEGMSDLTAKSCLGAVDRLSKVIPEVRGVYEMLCEFSHPNVGVHLALIQDTKLLSDKQGLHWVEKTISVEPPAPFIADTAAVLELILDTVNRALKLHLQNVDRMERQIARARKIAQVRFRQEFEIGRELFDLYAPCPCLSGSKIKFCCGRKKA